MEVFIKANLEGVTNFEGETVTVSIEGQMSRTVIMAAAIVFPEEIKKEIELNALKKLMEGLEFNHKFGGITGPQVMEALRDKIKELEARG